VISGIAALVVCMVVVAGIDVAPSTDLPGDRPEASAPPETIAGPFALPGREIMAGGYGGVSYTHPSTVEFSKPGSTDLKVDGFGWIGRPFKSPIYYGLRAIAWQPASRFGAMLDFTHAKAIANPEDTARFTGTRDGKAMPPTAKIGDAFRHLEFSHGHNIVTLNGMARLGLLARVRPYLGVGGGITLPHTEVGFAGETPRTYTYQFAGFAGQALAGIEIPLGRVSLFLEYKFTYAPYTVPLSHEPYGWLLVTDVWQQLREWLSGTPPPGGWLRTTLVTDHGIGGVLVRVTRPNSASR
jgi:hypothetical protein